MSEAGARELIKQPSRRALTARSGGRKKEPQVLNAQMYQVSQTKPRSRGQPGSPRQVDLGQGCMHGLGTWDSGPGTQKRYFSASRELREVFEMKAEWIILKGKLKLRWPVWERDRVPTAFLNPGFYLVFFEVIAIPHLPQNCWEKRTGNMNKWTYKQGLGTPEMPQ